MATQHDRAESAENVRSGSDVGLDDRRSALLLELRKDLANKDMHDRIKHCKETLGGWYDSIARNRDGHKRTVKSNVGVYAYKVGKEKEYVENFRDYVGEDGLSFDNDPYHDGAKRLSFPPAAKDKEPDCFVLLPDDSVGYRSAYRSVDGPDMLELYVSGRSKEVVLEMFNLAYKQDRDKVAMFGKDNTADRRVSKSDERMLDQKLRARIQTLEKVLGADHEMMKEGKETFELGGREYYGLADYANRNVVHYLRDPYYDGAMNLGLAVKGAAPSESFVLFPDNSVVYRVGKDLERKLEGRDKEVVLSTVLKDKRIPVSKVRLVDHGMSDSEQRLVDQKLRKRLKDFEKALDARGAMVKNGEHTFKADGREYWTMTEYIDKHAVSFVNDPFYAGAKNLGLAVKGGEPPESFALLPDNSVVYRVGELERKLEGRDEQIMQEVFGYVCKKQDKEIAVEQDGGKSGVGGGQDVGRSAADLSDATAVSVKTSDAVEKLQQHGLPPHAVAAVGNKKDGYDLVAVYRHRAATSEERGQFVGQLKKICPDGIGNGVPCEDVGKFLDKANVVWKTDSKVDFDKVIDRGRGCQASGLER